MTEEKAQNIIKIRILDPIKVKYDGEYIDGKVVGASMDRTRFVVSFFTSGMDTEKDSPKTKTLNINDIIETATGLCEK